MGAHLAMAAVGWNEAARGGGFANVGPTWPKVRPVSCASSGKPGGVVQRMDAHRSGLAASGGGMAKSGGVQSSSERRKQLDFWSVSFGGA